MMADTSLRSWLLKITGLPEELTRDVLEGFVGGKLPGDLELTDKELDVFVLYFVVTRRLFAGKSLSKKETMFIKAVQGVVTGMTTRLVIEPDVHWLWDTI